MKKIIVFTLVLSVLVGCSEESLTGEAEARRAAIARMEENAEVINQAFALTTEKFTSIGQSKLNALAATYSRDQFIRHMLDQTSGVIDNAINALRGQRGWAYPSTYTGRLAPVDSYIFKEHLDQILKGIEGASPGKGVIDLFSIFVEQEIESRAGGNPASIQIQSFKWSVNQTGSFGSAPIAFEDILFVKKNVEKLILLHEDEGDLDAAIDSFTEQHKEQAELVALLVPAIQQARETHQSGHTNNLKQMHLAIHGDGAILGLRQSEWTQKLRRAMFLAGVYSILHEAFIASDEDYASITPQRTMYEAFSVLTWVAYYDRPK